jgi:transcriptional regulator with XRE-family HTH domain
MKKESRDPFAVAVGSRLKAARIAAGYTQRQFAKLLGLPASGNLSNWENGWAVMPPEYAPTIYRLTKITSDYLYLGEPAGLPFAVYQKLFPPTGKDGRAA